MLKKIILFLVILSCISNITARTISKTLNTAFIRDFLVVYGYEIIKGPLTVQGAQVNNSDITVTGNATFNNLTIANNLTVAGNEVVKGTLTVKGNQTNDSNVNIDGVLNYGSGTSLDATLYPLGTSVVPGLKTAYALFNGGASPSIAGSYVHTALGITRSAAGKFTIDYSTAGFSSSAQPIVLRQSLNLLMVAAQSVIWQLLLPIYQVHHVFYGQCSTARRVMSMQVALPLTFRF